MRTKFFSALVCAVMLAGFTACETNQDPTENTGNGGNENQEGGGTTTPEPNYEYAIVLMDENLNGATATLSQKCVDAFTDEVILTITPNFEEFVWEDTPTIEVLNAQNSDLNGSKGVYTCKLTSFADNTTIKIAGFVGNLTPTGTSNNHGYVDLGLPSGLLWATCNVGANSPEEYGDYYAWGETSTKSEYSDDTYYYSSDPDVLPLSRDAANANWGGDWRMPTKEEIEELLDEDNCTWTWSKVAQGPIVTSKSNGNNIFLPAAGYRNNSSLNGAGTNGDYWSSSLLASYPYSAYLLGFGSDDYFWGGYYRAFGRSVRAVCKK